MHSVQKFNIILMHSYYISILFLSIVLSFLTRTRNLLKFEVLGKNIKKLVTIFNSPLQYPIRPSDRYYCSTTRIILI